MRKLFSLVAAAGLAMGVAAPAHATVQALTAASLSMQISALNPVVIAWNSTGSADVTATDVTLLTAGIFNFTGTVPVTDPGAFPIAGLGFTSVTNGVGNFFGVNALGGGKGAITGSASVCLFGSCGSSPSANINVPFTTGGVNGVGLGGAVITVKGAVNITVSGNVWTTGTVTLGTASVTGSPLSGGKVKLVNLTVLSTNIGASAMLPMFSVMDLTFIPEPGTLLLLGAGIAGLTMVGRRRMK
jgi:hypothetical protein